MTDDTHLGGAPQGGMGRGLLLEIRSWSVSCLRSVSDLVIGDLYKMATGYPEVADRLVLCASIALGVYLGVPLHELMHRVGDVLAGGSFGPVYIDPLFGGSLYRALLPGAFTDQSTNPLSILGAGSTSTSYVPTGTPLDYLHSVALLAAPSAILTPIGLAVLKRGLKMRNPAATGLGFSLAIIPLFDFTDLAGVFMVAVEGPSFTLLDAVSTLGPPEIVVYLLGAALLAGFFYGGSKRLVGKLDSSRTTSLERQLFGGPAPRPVNGR